MLRLRALRPAVLGVGLLAAALPHAGRAQAAVPAAGPAAVAGARTDTIRPAPIVTRGDLGRLALGAVAATALIPVDRAVRDALRRPGLQENGTLGSLEQLGDAWGGGGTLVAGVALWGGGHLAHRPTVAAAGLRAVEAVAVSGVITGTLKGILGRARPRVDSTEVRDFRLLRGMEEGGDYQSMPSGHTTAAFAFAAAVTNEVAMRSPAYARAVGITTFTLAGVTGWSRMHSNAHWLSDVTMGATVGMVSGWAVTRWHRTRPGNRVDAWVLGVPGGRTRLGVSVAWR